MQLRIMTVRTCDTLIYHTLHLRTHDVYWISKFLHRLMMAYLTRRDIQPTCLDTYKLCWTVALFV